MLSGGRLTAPSPPPRVALPARVASLAVAGAAVWLAVDSGLARFRGASFLFNTWSDRDLLRGWQLPEHWTAAGAELSFGPGGRVPGPLLPLLLGAPQRLGTAALDVFRFQTALDLLGALVVAVAGWRLGGVVCAAVALATVQSAEAATDGTSSLWNPGLVPLFTALGTLGLSEGARTRDTRWLPLVVLGFGLAAQLHLSAALPLVGGVLALAALRPTGLARGGAWAALTLAALQAPYVITEALQGWPNTRLLLAGSQSDLLRGRLAKPELHVLPDVLHVLTLPPVIGDAGRVALALPLLAALGLLATLAGRGARGTAARVLVATIAVEATFFFLEGRVGLGGISGQQRYFTVVVPAASLLVGLGAGRVVEAVDARAGGVGGVLARLGLVGLIGVLGRAGVEARAHRAMSPGLALRQEAAFADVAAATGWSLAEIAGRTVGVRGKGPNLGRMAELPMTWRLAVAGFLPPRPTPPPCALLVLEDDGETEVDEALVDRIYGRVLPGRTLLGQTRLPHGARLVQVGTTDLACPAATAQGYVPEAIERGAPTDLPPGEPVALPAPAPGVRRAAASLELAFEGDRSLLPLVAELDARACPVRLTFSSSRLRGVLWNLDALRPAVLEDPVIELVGDHGTVEVPLGISRLGAYGVPAPFTVALPTADGVREVRLRAGSRSAVNDGVDEQGAVVQVVGPLVRGEDLATCGAALPGP